MPRRDKQALRDHRLKHRDVKHTNHRLFKNSGRNFTGSSSINPDVWQKLNSSHFNHTQTIALCMALMLLSANTVNAASNIASTSCPRKSSKNSGELSGLLGIEATHEIAHDNPLPINQCVTRPDGWEKFLPTDYHDRRYYPLTRTIDLEVSECLSNDQYYAFSFRKEFRPAEPRLHGTKPIAFFSSGQRGHGQNIMTFSEALTVLKKIAASDNEEDKINAIGEAYFLEDMPFVDIANSGKVKQKPELIQFLKHPGKCPFVRTESCDDDGFDAVTTEEIALW